MIMDADSILGCLQICHKQVQYDAQFAELVSITGFSNEGLRLLPKAKNLAQVGRWAMTN